MSEKLIARKWTYAHEEDTEPGVQVYRPSEGKFPLSRGRQKLDLSSVTGKRTTIGADDRYVDTGGAWTLSADGKTLTFTPEGGGGVVRYEVLSLAKDRLVVKRMDVE